MGKIILDGAMMTDRAAAHAYLQAALELPAYYGANLDALWDCLTTDCTPREVVITNGAAISASLGNYGEALVQVFLAAAATSDSLTVRLAVPEPESGFKGPGRDDEGI